ncbi:MAG: hypothetical protein HYZ34_13280 [Ignavibacteriae bacterium]|nr:hypothetical protein [Ignavibacteriota bacterium]
MKTQLPISNVIESLTTTKLFSRFKHIVRVTILLLLCVHLTSAWVLAKEKSNRKKATTSTQSVRVSSGWNLMSLPLFPTNGFKNYLFPSAASSSFMYQNGYVEKRYIRKWNWFLD